MSFVPALLLLILLAWNATAGALTLTDEEKPGSALTHTCAWASMPPGRLSSFATGRPLPGIGRRLRCLDPERLGISLKPIEPSNWTEVLQQAREKRIDLLPGIMSTPERQQYLAFTRPYPDFPIVIPAHKGGPQPRTLEDLYGLKVAVVENYAPMSCCALTTRT